MVEIGNLEIKWHERRRSRKVILCEEEWEVKERRAKKFLANKRLNMKYKIVYKSNN